jgi:hypothetical protein
MRQSIVGAYAICALTGACSTTRVALTPQPPALVEALRHVPATSPSLPRSDSDSIVATVLEQIAFHGTVDLPPARLVVVKRDSAFPSSSALPRIGSITFFLLTEGDIRRVADRSGELSYLNVDHPKILGDSAVVSVSTALVVDAARADRGYGRYYRGPWNLGGCAWALKRVKGSWRVLKPLCLIV